MKKNITTTMSRFYSAAKVIAVAAIFQATLTPVAMANDTRASSAPVTNLLITGFEHFGLSFTNYSAKVAALSKTYIEKYVPNVHVTVCILPVDYDKATAALFECIAKMPSPPQRILSLGENAQTGLTIETLAHNLDGTPYAPDNAGVTRNHQVIIAGAPDSLPLTGFPIQSMMDRLNAADRARVTISTNLGTFVCNNFAFETITELKGQIPFQFIHVPDGTYANASPAESTRMLMWMQPWL